MTHVTSPSMNRTTAVHAMTALRAMATELESAGPHQFPTTSTLIEFVQDRIPVDDLPAASVIGLFGGQGGSGYVALAERPMRELDHGLLHEGILTAIEWLEQCRARSARRTAPRVALPCQRLVTAA